MATLHLQINGCEVFCKDDTCKMPKAFLLAVIYRQKRMAVPEIFRSKS